MLKTSHFFLLISVAILWGLNFVVIKIGLEHFPPIFFNALRFFMLAPLIFFLPKPAIAMRKIIAVALLLGVGKFSVMFVGISYGVGAGVTSVVIQSQIFFTIIVCALLFQEKVRLTEMLGISLGVIGISFILGASDTGGTTLIGLLLILTASLFWAFSNAVMKTAAGSNPLGLIVWSGTFASVPLLLISIAFEGTEQVVDALQHIDMTAMLSLLYLSFVSTLFGYAAWGNMLARYTAAQVVPFGMIVPVAGLLGGVVFLGEPLLTSTLIGAGFILCGIAIGQFGGHEKVRRVFKNVGNG